jgi:hypothetical protein
MIAGAAGSLVLAISAQAGSSPAPAAAATAPATAETVGLFDSVGLTLETGYDSEYYFRGLWFSSNNVWTGATLSLPFSDKFAGSLGALYTSSVDTNIPGSFEYSELDLFAGLTYDAGFAKFGLIYTYYNFFDTFSGSVNGSTFGFPEAPDSTITSRFHGLKIPFRSERHRGILVRLQNRWSVLRSRLRLSDQGQ